MNHLLSSALLGATLAFGASVTASAAPVSPSPAAPSTKSSVEKAHGFHRSCRGEHRHTGHGRIHCSDSYRYSEPGITLRFGDRDRGHHRHDRDDRKDRRGHDRY
jgi:hypothetical protein